MPSFHEILFAFLLPACVCGTILLVALRSSSSGDRGRRWQAAAGCWAIGLAYLLGHVELAGFPGWPSAQRTPSALDWLGWSVAFMLPFAGLFLTALGERRVAWIARIVFSVALVLLSLRTWMLGGGSTWTAIGFLSVLILAWTSTDALVRRSPGPVPVLPLFVTALCASVASLLGNSALVAELGLVLCGCLAAATAVVLIGPNFQLSPGTVAVFMVVLAGVLLNGVFFGDVPWSSALFSVASLTAPWIAALSTRPSRGPWTSTAVRALIAAVFGAGAIIAAHLNAPSYEY